MFFPKLIVDEKALLKRFKLLIILNKDALGVPEPPRVSLNTPLPWECPFPWKIHRTAVTITKFFLTTVPPLVPLTHFVPVRPPEETGLL